MLRLVIQMMFIDDVFVERVQLHGRVVALLTLVHAFRSDFVALLLMLLQIL